MSKSIKNIIVITSLILITIGIFLTYSIKNGVYAVKQIKLEPVNIVEETGGRKKLGITKFVETTNAKYYVNTSANLSDSEIISYVNNSELMFKLAEDELDMPANKYETEFSDKLSSANRKMKYNPNDKNAEGIIFSSIGNGKLPAWLCVGLERHYKEKYGFQKYKYEKFDMNDWLKSNKENNLPGFGDYWFIKDFMNEDVKEKACIVSHRFVDYLAKENYLKDIVNFYRNNENDSSILVEDKLNKFLNTTNVNITNEVLYTYNNIVITKPKAIYTIENGVETWDTLNDDIDFMEKGMLFIEDIFDREFNNKVYVSIELKKSLANEAVTSYGKIKLSGGRYAIPAAVHEMTHAYFFDKGNNVFMFRASLEEGLCNYVAIKYEKKFRLNADEQMLEQFDTIAKDISFDDKLMYYYKKFKKHDEYDNAFFSRAKYDAIATIQLFDAGSEKYKNTSMLNYFKNRSYNELELINSYSTSTSFVYYLLEEKIDLDDFLLLMEDLDEFNKQNDKPLSQLVDNWLNYLEQAAF